jgi:4-hydroxybenzoate polyprenyltransferase/phosphoserine phosphatase
MVNDVAAADVPLVVDMDGTLIKVDSLQEAFVQLSFRKPLQALRALLALKGGRASFKASVAAHMVPDVGSIPFEQSVVEAIRQAKAKGRKVYLATAADRRFADVVAQSVGYFDGVFASESGVNLKGRHKADYIVQKFGKGGFDYIGNDAADIPVWREARTAIISGASARETQHYRAEIPELVSLNSRVRSFTDYFRALRPKEWLKNALVAVPAIAVRDPAAQTATLLAFASFCFAASAIYLFNDMLDVEQDRSHPDKRHRPLAAGVVQLRDAVGLLGLSIALAALFSFFLPLTFSLAVIAYGAGAIIYSLYFRTIFGLDAIALAALYGTRVWGGSAATGIALSFWPIVVCSFLFLSLALLRRSGEKLSLAKIGLGGAEVGTHAHRYTNLAALCGFLAVLAFAVHIIDVKALYHRPELLWASWIAFGLWLGRIFSLARRGRMPGDPITFSVTDWISLMSTIASIGCWIAAF